MNKFAEMETFVRVIDSGGISRAADQMGIAKSAVSRRINELESRLNVQLIKRTTRTFSLTNTGKAYYDVCIRLLNDMAEAESAISEEKQELTGTLRMTVPLSFGLLHLAPTVHEFCRLHPNVKFDLDLNDRQVNIIEENVDIAIRIGKLSDSQLIARRLFDVSSVLCASPTFLKQHGPIEHPNDLASLSMIRYSLIKYAPLQYTDKDGTNGSLKPKVSQQCSNGDFICQLVSKGMGYTLTPRFIAYQHIKAGTLVPILNDYSWGGIHAYAVYPSSRHLSYRVRAYIDFLVQYFGDKPYWDQLD